jgi:mono/diheme cytochrome c family protein
MGCVRRANALLMLLYPSGSQRLVLILINSNLIKAANAPAQVTDRHVMKSSADRLEWLLLITTGLVLAVVLVVYLLASSGLNQTYSAPLESVTVPEGVAAVAEGERLATIRGCFWCHGAALEGQKYFAEADKGLIVAAPNLPRKLREYSVAEFARSVRHGVRADGTSLQPAMPSFALYNMSDEDMGYIIAYIQSLPEQEGLEGEFRLLPVGWFRWVLGDLPPNVATLIDHAAPRPDPAVNGSPVVRGKYLAESVCTECHGNNGRIRVPITPDIEIAVTYSREDFFRLMRTGAPAGDKKIDYHMVDVGKYRYVRMTDAEVDALYQYFQSLLSTGG